MKVIKWLDEHFEEAILIFLLVIISCVTLLQIIARNTPILTTTTWAEELCRFVWIATVFLSLPFTIRTETSLRVTALIDILPWKLRNIVNIVVDVITAALMAFLSYYAVIVLQRIMMSGEVSPAMTMPMYFLYAIVLVGFVLATLRSIEMFVIHIKNVNVEPMDTTQAQAEFEISGTAEGAASVPVSAEGSAIESAFSNRKGK